MALAVVKTRALQGITAIPVEVEVLTSNGLPGISIVGLPETAVKESKDRVRGALKSSGFKIPQQRITVNLAPADLPKEGGRYDLPIAIGILAASGQINTTNLSTFEFAGELALSGELRSIKGSLPTAIASYQSGCSLIIPHTNLAEATLAKKPVIIGSRSLLEICAHLNQVKLIPTSTKITPIKPITHPLDISDIKGQNHAKRALQIAAAGGHNLLFIGPPGTGKTMLATRLSGIMPALSETEAIETASIYSVSNINFDFNHWQTRPFRAPHHTSSGVALVGGGSIPRPGEISLAHNGVLFLDELTEFDRRVLDVLREPLESGHITISRAARQADFPANFQLIAACNPCLCGFLGDGTDRCHCTEDQIKRYKSKISGPLMDRIDLQVEVPKVPIKLLQTPEKHGINSNEISHLVAKARTIQLKRSGLPNHKLNGKELEQVCQIDQAGQQLLQRAMDKLNLSARAYHRILKVARTIADLAEENSINKTHLAEAISYRIWDRE